MFARILLASLSARRLRLALSLLAVTVGIAVATALGTLALRVGDDLARTLRASGPNFVMLPRGAGVPRDPGGATIAAPRARRGLPLTAVAELKRSYWKNNVLDAAPERTLAVRITRGDGGAGAARARDSSVATTRALLHGTWFDHSTASDDGPWRTGLARLRPAWRVSGRWPQEDSNELALGRELATRLDAHPGQHVTLDGVRERATWMVTGIVDAGGAEDRQAWAPLASVQQLAGHDDGLDRVWLSALVLAAPTRPAPDPARDPMGYERYMCSAFPDNVAHELSGRIADCEVLPASEVLAGEAHVVGRLNQLMLLLALAALTASTLGLLSTTTATVVERRVELGLLRSLGAEPHQIAALILSETLLVAVLGGALGWLLGSLAAAAIRGDAFGSGGSFLPLLLPAAIALAIACAAFGTLVPLRMAARIEPATALRG